MSRRDSIQSRMRRMVVASCGFMAAVLAVTLALVLVYNGQYKNLLYNVTTASEFNQDFKENIDLKMYYYVIESRYSEGLPIQEVQAAQALARDLLDSTSQKDSLQAVTSVLDLCENLEEKIYQIEQTQSYDSRQMQLENNIYVLTALIQEYMYNYLYYESVRLNLLLQQISRQITAEILLVALLSAVLIALLARYSVRLSRSVAQPVVDLSRRAEDVIGGDLTVREPVRSETYEIRTLSEGMEQMIARINAQIQEITQKQTSLRKAELALLQAQINPHFLYNTMEVFSARMELAGLYEESGAISAFCRMLRYNMNTKDMTVAMKQEIRQVKDYLAIQKIRKIPFEIAFDIPPELMEEPVIRFLLEPFVENSFKYRGAVSPLYIRIAVQSLGRQMEITIENNGESISPDRLAELNERFRSEPVSVKSPGSRVGLTNINSRLKLFYGEGHYIQASSGGGITAFRFRVERRALPPQAEKGAPL